MAHTHEFDCTQCGAHLDSQQQLDQHIREQHSQNASPSVGRDESNEVKPPQRSSDRP
jgi:hypothetical protein